MKRFISNVLFFLFILLLMVIVLAFFPPTPKSSKSYFFSKIDKDLLLQNIESPRIIFVGGSGLSMGLNSKMIHDALDIYPINTGVNAGIGLIYMMDSTLPYVRSGDIVLVIPVYEQFYGSFAYGNKRLLRTVMDVSRFDLGVVRKKQWVKIIPCLPRYSFSKLKPTEYFGIKDADVGFLNSFNEYGDATYHWNLAKRKFAPFGPGVEPFDYSVVDELHDFEKKLIEKGAVLFVSFPAFQETSFNNNKADILKVEEELIKKGFSVLGTPDRYKLDDSLMFDSPYHLTKKGADFRTKLLLEDIEVALNEIKNSNNKH
jgi:hypothetical protein